MEAIGTIAKAPFRAVCNGISEFKNLTVAESSILAKVWHFSLMLFLVFLVPVAITWFIVVKATQITLIITIGLFALTLKFGAGG